MERIIKAKAGSHCQQILTKFLGKFANKQMPHSLNKLGPKMCSVYDHRYWSLLLFYGEVLERDYSGVCFVFFSSSFYSVTN